jgi:hypothetical protein
MKFKVLVALFASAALLTGCPEEKKDEPKKDEKKEEKKDDKKKDEKKDEKKEEPKAEGGDMPQECKDYMKAIDDCAGKSPAAKTAMEATKKAFEDGWNAAKGTPAAAAAYKDTCTQGSKALTDNPACK